MKSLLINIRNLIPYIGLIILYFFFINIEAQNDQKNKNIINLKKSNNIEKTNIKENFTTIAIPVIPYSQ